MLQVKLDPAGLTWSELVKATPQLENYRRCAQQAGTNGFLGYCDWVSRRTEFVYLTPNCDVRHHVLRHLRQVMEQARVEAERATRRTKVKAR